MLSLLYTLTKYVLGHKDSVDSVDVNDIDTIIARIESIKDESKKKDDLYNEERYYYKTGNVTFIADDYVLVDDNYVCEMTNVLPNNIKIGNKVSYSVFETNQNEEQKVFKIFSVLGESWNDTSISTDIKTNVSQTGVLRRSIIGKVTERKNRNVVVEPNNISFNLDEVYSEFVPLIGDWLKLESFVEIDENSSDLSGEILKVNKIVPVRSKQETGIISSYDKAKDIGTIGKNIVFNKKACESGYIPCVGDKVVADSIESDQGSYTWRSIIVVPLFQTSERHVQLSCSSTKSSNTYTKTHFPYKNKKSISEICQDENNQVTYIPGVQPCKPPAFIKIRNGVFKVPKRIWDAVLKTENKSQIESEVIIGEAITCLVKGLCFETYKERFHTLLYLEEIAQTLNIRRYDIESVNMRHSGEYLVMQVQGLAEKRPSLLIGDRAIVSFKWDSTQGNLKYEGYIHKVTSTEIFLKFNKKFHQDYNREDCYVTFKCSHTAIQRSHSAINVAVIRLGPDFLFPTRVVQKSPQLNLEEIETEENPIKLQSRHERNESISSSYSSTSSITTSISDNSDKIIKPSPRISVAERLFNAKPIEQSTEMIKTDSYFKEKIKNTKVNSRRCNECKENNVPNESVIKNASSTLCDDDTNLSNIKKQKLTWFNKDLNRRQKEAVRNILKGVARPLPYIIFGPPGTGKTATLCESILQILTMIPESRLLVATPSNSSANLVSERLLSSGVLMPGDLVRLIAHHCLDDNSIPEALLPYCMTADLAERKGEKFEQTPKGPKIKCTMETLGRHRVTIGTCIALSVLHNIGFPRGHFSHVLVDEAGQATEPEIMIPLNFIHSDYGQVILAGDPLQLGPVVQSQIAKDFGYGESFLARLLLQFPYQRDPDGFETGYDSRLVTKLIMNYRSLPEILQLTNSLFYDSELLPQVSSKKSDEARLLETIAKLLPERKGSPPAIVFHGVNGENFQDPDSPSWYNPEEATQAYLYLLRLYECGLRGNDIGIITPYQKQVLQIRNLLMELDVDLPKLSSVEGFQGQERKVIILSTVRSSSNLIDQDINHALGFVASPRRLNVAITRARALLIIIGNPKLLVQDPYWRSVLIYCINHGGYTGCDFSSSHIEDLKINGENILDVS